MSIRDSWRILAVAGLCCLIPSFAITADSKTAYTDSAEADADFADQGEYTGRFLTEAGQWIKAGLQVVALGNGQFDGVLFEGGLPGSGWNFGEKYDVSGFKSTGPLRLEGETVSVQLDGNDVSVYRPGKDERVGQLRRTNRVSATLGKQAPAGAIILFNGQENEELKQMKLSPEGWLEIGAETVRDFQDFYLHAEFRLPYMPEARGQGRANSGFYLQRRYEVQVLDSFGLEPQFNDAAALYRQRIPDRNVCFPPLSWQTYDIWFKAARFDNENKKTENAVITVRFNGITVHNNVEIIAKTGAGRPEGPEPMPILFQNHGNPVRFRNMWIVEGESTAPPIPFAHQLPASWRPSSVVAPKVVSR